ncbi:MAG TPA: LuxR C-terminal-related transcriptional regulator [Cryobacterium sp.]|nr:LuxR C-terminal-related transcriptional regulator [Cryobacterium sp.]
MTVHRGPIRPGNPGADLSPEARSSAALPPLSLPVPAGAEIPGPTAAEVERHRLDGALHRLSAGEVRCVCLWAAAGSGKTTLLAAWARRLRQTGESVTWLRAPELGRFRPADVWRQAGQAGQGGPDALPAGVPADERTRYVFIDDLDRAAEDRPGLLGELVASAPAGIRLVIAGRTEPGAGLTRLHATGSIVTVRPTDLAFDRSELLALAARHRLLLTEQETTTLLQRTAGWATGLAVIVPFLRGRDDCARLVRDFDGDDPAVAGFLRSEIIAGWADGDENTMLRVAVTAVVSVDLAAELTKRTDAGAVLDRLAGRGQLITRESGGDTSSYRIHPILLAYLQGESRRRDAGAAATAHETAARWFARRGESNNALEQALAAGLPDLVAEMLDAFGVDLVLKGTPDLVLRALAGPAALAGNRGSAVPVTLTLLLDAPYFPDRGRAAHLLAQLRAAGRPSATGAAIWTVVIDALTAFFATTPDGLRDGLSGLTAARNAPGRREDLGVDLLAATAEAWCRAGLGEAEQAEAGLRMVAVTARNAGYPWLVLLAGDLAATSASRRGDWARAGLIDDQLARATDAAARPAAGAGASPPGRPFDRAAARAWVSLQIRRYERCEPVDLSTLERLVQADPLVSDSGLIVPAQALLALSSLAAHPRPRSVLERLAGLMRENAVAHPRVLSLCCIPWFDLTRALDGRPEARRVAHLVEAVLGPESLEAVLLRSLAYPPARGRHGAGGRLEAAATPAARCWRGSTLVSAWIVLAGIAEESERPAEADARLVRALRLAEQLRVERAFLDAGGLAVSLLDPRIGRLGDLDAFAKRILTLAGQTPREARPAPVAPLTERERELLRELPFHQSVADIARKHNVSPNTVKTHLRNIYQKLEASDRARAVVIAHERGLL